MYLNDVWSPVPTSVEIYCVPIANKKRLMLFVEIASVYYENHTKYVHAYCVYSSLMNMDGVG
jgi:hypothetical protein